MATLYISEHPQMSIHQGNNGSCVDEPAVAEQTLAIGVAVQSAAFNAKTRIVRLHPDATCSVKFGDSPTATTSNKRLAGNSTHYVAVRPGQKLSVIANT